VALLSFKTFGSSYLFSGGRVALSTGTASRPTSDNEAPVTVPPPGERFDHWIASVNQPREDAVTIWRTFQLLHRWCVDIHV